MYWGFGKSKKVGDTLGLAALSVSLHTSALRRYDSPLTCVSCTIIAEFLTRVQIPDYSSRELPSEVGDVGGTTDEQI